MFEKKVTQEEMEHILNQMNFDIIFYDYLMPRIYVKDYNETPVTRANIKFLENKVNEQEKIINALMEYFGVEIFDGVEIRKINKK
jgi:hypothetical protein